MSFNRIIATVKGIFVNTKSKKGFIVMMVAALVPVVMLSLYLIIKNQGRSEQRVAFEQAVKNAALDTARKYIQNRTVAKQKDYLERIAAVSFNNSIKSAVGITKNVIPLTLKVMTYLRCGWTYFNGGYDYSYDLFGGRSYWNTVPNRFSDIERLFTTSSQIDPDADETLDAFMSGTTGYVIVRKGTDWSGGSNEHNEVKRLYYKSTAADKNNITVTSVDSDKIKVNASAVINNRSYTASYTATAPKLNVDIILGIPQNTAASSTNNDPYGTAVIDSNWKSTPIWQIKTECREFVKKILSCRNCAIGLIPYWGNVTLPKNLYSKTVSRGSYKYSDYPAVNPTMPIAECYKFTLEGGVNGRILKEAGDLATDVKQTRIMYRSDLESYLNTYMSNGTTNPTAIENLIYGEVDENTKFMKAGIDVAYGGSANIMAGYSRYNSPMYSAPYPMYGLTQDPLVIYRYLSLIFPFADQYKRSSFAYLPIMFGMSMLNNGFQSHSPFTSSNTRKKALILICNQADLWFPREMTYFGFVNDASYIPMVDGDRIDYEKGTLESAGNGYYRSKIYRSSDIVYNTGNYDTSNANPGIFFNTYDEEVAIKCTYPPKGDGEGKMLVYTTNSQSTAVVNSISYNSGNGGATPTLSNGVYTCVVPSSATSESICYTIGYDKSDTTPDIIARVDLNNCEITNIPNPNIGVRQEGNYSCFYETNPFHQFASSGAAFQVYVKFKAGGSSAGSSESPTTGTYSLVLPKPGNTKIVVQADSTEVTTGQMLVYKTNPHTTVSLSNVTYYSGTGGATPTSANSIWTCKVPTTATSSSPVYYQITYTKSDTTSPVVAKLELKGCEVVSISNSSLVFRQDTDYVYVCENSTSVSNGSSISFYIGLKYISSSSDMTQHTALGYVNKYLATGTDSSSKVSCGDISGKTTYTGNAYNSKIRFDSSTTYIPSMTLEKICPFSSTTVVPFRSMDYIYTDYTPDKEYNSTFSNIEQAYWGIFIGEDGVFPTDSSLYGNSSFSGRSISSSSKFSKIVAEYYSAGGTGDTVPSCIDGSSSASYNHIRFYKYVPYYYAANDGDKATETRVESISAVECVEAGNGRDWVNDPNHNTSDSPSKTPTDWNDNNGDPYRDFAAQSYAGWMMFKVTPTNTTNPVMARIDCKHLYVDETDAIRSSGNTQCDNRAWVRNDGTHYYLGNRLNRSEYYVIAGKMEPWIMPNSDVAECWRLSYANRHLLGCDDLDNGTTSVKSYTFTSPSSKNPYWVYARGAKLTAYWDTQTHNTSKGSFLFSSTDITSNFKLYCSYKQYSSSNYVLFHNIVSCGSYPSDHYLSTSRMIFNSSTYVYLRTTKTRTFKSAVVARSISFSGNYTKTYSLSTANYYYTIYIPRGKFSGSLGTNDSATINFTLNGAKVIYIEWSNHLNGTEGCYSRSSATELLNSDTQIGSGSYAVYYEPLKRSKNARARWWDPASNTDFSRGHTTLQPTTENNGYGAPDYDSSNVYLENIRTKRSREYNGIKKKTSGSYDYPYYDGDVTLVVTNPRRVQNVFSWLHDNTTPAHSWEYNYINGVGRYSTMWGRFNNYDAKKGTEETLFVFNSKNGTGSYIEDYLVRLEWAEATINVNRMLMAAGYQTCSASDTGSSMASSGSTYLMRSKVTPKMVTAFNNKFGSNGRIYVIHYKYTPGSYSGWSANLGGVYKNYTVSTQADLKAKLHEILQDIKSWAGYEDAKIVD